MIAVAKVTYSRNLAKCALKMINYCGTKFYFHGCQISDGNDSLCCCNSAFMFHKRA